MKIVDGVTDEDEDAERWQMRKMKKDDEMVDDNAEEANDGDGAGWKETHHGQT